MMIRFLKPTLCLGLFLPHSSCFTFHTSKFPLLSPTYPTIESNLSPFVSSTHKTTLDRISCKNTFLQLSQDENDETKSDPNSTQKRRRRTRRKADSILSEEADGIAEEPADEVLIGTSSTQFVEMEVPDIRSITSGATTGSVNSDDDEYEYYDDDDDEDSSLEGLLADAKRLRASKGTTEEEEEVNIGPVIKNVISTIVTVDFFVVLALLAWFLAGIFGSYVLKTDTVQVAFNGIFEPVVQPALGILMIASAAGGAMGGDDKN